jgi:threonine/homoserine/homoserine lactone efflux protein
MTTELILALAAFAFVSSITPGPNNLMLMASGTNFGFRLTVPHMMGVTIGFTLMIVLVGLGLAQVFEAFPIAHDILKYASIAYLLYLAWKIASAGAPASDTTKGEKAKGGDGEPAARPMTFLQAALFQWVNPKAWTMALSAIAAYTLPDQPLLSLVVIALIFGLVNLPCVSSWALLGMQMRRYLNDPAKLRIFNITAAVLLVASLYPIVFGSH